MAVFFFSCQTEEEKKQPIKQQTINSAPFNADSAYHFVEKQVAFGPRVPATPAHDSAVQWMVKKLEFYADQVQVQEGVVTTFNDKKLPIKNIIASFNPNAKKRILLCAHYDSRPFADQDTANQDQPILGANDGGSGVGVLLEIARQLKQNPVNYGIDIILFDAEDYGQPDRNFMSDKPGKSGYKYKADTWALGSQYWAKNPHKSNYTAYYGILLDMVGAEGAVFTMEGTSMQYAPNIMRKVWNLAAKLGYSNYFLFQQTSPITDDHYYINTIANIPTIDIIQHDFSTRSGFGKYWHTHDDNMGVISRATLKAVGQTVLTLLYMEGKSV